MGQWNRHPMMVATRVGPWRGDAQIAQSMDVLSNLRL